MIFLGQCPDKVGIIAKITKFFAERGINIITLQEHAENQRFFVRINGKPTKEISKNIEKEFEQIGEDLEMKYQFFLKPQKTKIVMFCSKTLHCPLEVLSQSLSGALNAEIVAIISNHRDFEKIAQKFSIPFYYTETKPGSLEHEEEQTKILQNLDYDVIALARYMKILSGNFLESIEKQVINIHHSFLPSFIGNNPYEMAHKRGVKLIGATAHFVTEDLDEGPIIHQDVVRVHHGFSVTDLKQVGANVEKEVFSFALQKYCEHKVLERGGRTVVFH